MRPNPQETADLVTFTEQILNGKLHFLCSDVIRHTQTVFRGVIFHKAPNRLLWFFKCIKIFIKAAKIFPFQVCVFRSMLLVNQMARFLWKKCGIKLSLYADKHQNFLHVGTKSFGGRGRAYPHSQSNCRIFRGVISPGGRDELP